MAGDDQVTLPDTEVHFLDSSHVGDEFRISVAGCEGAPSGVGVLVVTDASLAYGTALETVRLLAMSEHIKPLLVVGVGYRSLTLADTLRLRTRDFTPGADPRYDEVDPSTMGGADRFGSFLDEELKPWIVEHYEVDAGDFGLFGYSLGGLFATHLLLTRPAAFQRWAIGSPSYWFGPGTTVETEQAYADTHDDLPAKVYVSIGEFETREGDDRHREQMTPEAREASLREEEKFPMEDMVGQARDLVGTLRGRGYPSLDITFEIHPGEYHPTAPPLTISRAVRFLYDAPT